MPSPIVNRLLNSKRSELPPQCVFYIDPDLDRGKTTLTDWAALYGQSKAKDLINVLGNEGNFEGANLSYWSLASTPTLSNERYKTGTKSLKIDASGSTIGVYKEFSYANGNIIYACCYGYLTAYTAGNFGIRLYDIGGFSNASSGSTTELNAWKFLSVTKTVSNGGIRMGALSGSTPTLTGYVDSIILINLTTTFGSGNEPTKAEMDTFIQANPYFWVTTHPKCRADAHLNLNVVDAETWSSNAIIVRKFTGVDYLSCANHSNIDILTATTQNPLCIFGVAKADTLTGWIMCKNNSLSSDTQYGLFFNSSTNKLDFYLDGSIRVSSNELTTGKYYLYYAVWDGANAYVYINKVLHNSAAYAGTLTSRTYFNIGKRADDEYFIGELGITGIMLSNVNDLNYWVDKLKIMQRYNITA